MYVTIKGHGFDLPTSQFVVSGTRSNPTPVNAAYNRRLGDIDSYLDSERVWKRGESVVGYFDANGILFAWSYFMAYTTNIGIPVDQWRFDWRWQDTPEGPFKRKREYYLTRPMQDGDL